MDQELVQKAEAIALKHGKALAKELALEVVLVAIEKAVQASETKIDDVVWAAMKKAAQDAVEKL